MDVADITEAQLPQLAALMRSLSGLETDMERLGAAFRAMAALPDYHLLGVSVEGALVGPGREEARAFYTACGYFESWGFKKRL